MATDIEIPELDSAGLRQFAFTTGGILVVLFGLGIPWVFGFAYPWWPWIIAIVLGILGLAAPASLRPIYRGWMHFGLFMSKIMTPLVLGIVFFLVFAPMGLIMRLWHRDRLARALSDEVQTYRIQSEARDPKSMERPY